MLGSIQSSNILVKTEVSSEVFTSFNNFKNKAKLIRAGLMVVESDAKSMPSTLFSSVGSLPLESKFAQFEVTEQEYSVVEKISKQTNTPFSRVLRLVLLKGLACMSH